MKDGFALMIDDKHRSFRCFFFVVLGAAPRLDGALKWNLRSGVVARILIERDNTPALVS